MNKQYQEDLKNAVKEYEETDTPIEALQIKYNITGSTIRNHTDYRRGTSGRPKYIDRKKVCDMYKRGVPFEIIQRECQISKNWIFKVLRDEDVPRDRV